MFDGPVVHVVEGRQRKLLEGSPWIYRNEIRAIEGATGRESRAYLRVPPATPPSTEQAEKAAE